MDTQLDDSFDDLNRCFVCRIQESEVKEALKRMKGGKAMDPDGIPIEVKMPWGYCYRLANQVVQPYFFNQTRCPMSGGIH
jgi:hypothetical protein